MFPSATSASFFNFFKDCPCCFFFLVTFSSWGWWGWRGWNVQHTVPILTARWCMRHGTVLRSGRRAVSLFDEHVHVRRRNFFSFKTRGTFRFRTLQTLRTILFCHKMLSAARDDSTPLEDEIFKVFLSASSVQTIKTHSAIVLHSFFQMQPVVQSNDKILDSTVLFN